MRRSVEITQLARARHIKQVKVMHLNHSILEITTANPKEIIPAFTIHIKILLIKSLHPSHYKNMILKKANNLNLARDNSI